MSSNWQEESDNNTLNEHDRFLPIANVTAIMKSALPEHVKVAKEAKKCMQECASEFISFVTSEAAETCKNEKRKAVAGEDIIQAATLLGFEQYAAAMKLYQYQYRQKQISRLSKATNVAAGPMVDAEKGAEAGNNYRNQGRQNAKAQEPLSEDK